MLMHKGFNNRLIQDELQWLRIGERINHKLGMLMHKCLNNSAPRSFIHSFIHSGHFYSAPSSPLLLRGAPDNSTDTVSEFHAEAHRQLQVKDLPKVPTWRLEWESNPRPSG